MQFIIDDGWLDVASRKLELLFHGYASIMQFIFTFLGKIAINIYIVTGMLTISLVLNSEAKIYDAFLQSISTKKRTKKHIKQRRTNLGITAFYYNGVANITHLLFP